MLYNYAYNYTINVLNINSAKKNMWCTLIFSKKVHDLLKIFQQNGIIRYYKIIFLNNKKFKIKVYLNYYKNFPLTKKIKLISRPSKTFFISVKALLIIKNRTHGSVFILSTTDGLINHTKALQYNKGGVLICFFSV